jgi:hypothetical protein
MSEGVNDAAMAILCCVIDNVNLSPTIAFAFWRRTLFGLRCIG